MIKANFKFHPIGQGCFYSGVIQLPKTEFNFVYDCGTDSKMVFLSREINNYKTRLNGKPLDLLLISHFDADHVNGVSQLLTGTRCTKVVIPYYSPIERLLLATQSKNVTEDYLFFLQNPVNYFIERGVEQIILVGGPEDEQGFEEPINPEKLVPSGDVNLEEIDGQITLDADFVTQEQAANFFSDLKNNDVVITNIEKVKILKKPYKLSIKFWEFVFYIKKHDDSILIQKITDDINELLKKENIVITELFDTDYITELRKIYALYFKGDFNNTSLVTYHGATIIPRRPFYIFDDTRLLFSFNDCNKLQLGTLLTGDIDVTTKRATKKIIDYYKNYLERICFFQVPHHGAKANWNFNVPNKLDSFCYYIINHGLGRKHHPSLDVVDYIKTNCKKGVIQLNNEAQQFEYGCEY